LFVVQEQGPLDAFRKSSSFGGRSADGFIGQPELKSLLKMLGLRGMAHTFLLATKDEHALTAVPVHMREYVQGECWSICHDTQDILKQYPDMQDVSAWLNCRHAGSNFSSCAEHTDHFSWVPVRPRSSPCPYVAVRDSAQVVLVENTLTSQGKLPSIRVIDRRHHETGLWCFECADVFWVPSSADANAVRSLHHDYCLGQNKSDFIWLDDTCLWGGCVRSHAAHNVCNNLHVDKHLCSDTQLEELLKFPGAWKHTSSVSHDSCPWELSAGADLVLPGAVRPHWRKPFINLKTMLQGVVQNQVAFFTKGQCCAALGFALAWYNPGAALCKLFDVQYSNSLQNVLLLPPRDLPCRSL
jgi:hypothetical protein